MIFMTETPKNKDAEIKDKIMQSLKKVMDPELGYNLVDLGLIYKTEVNSKEKKASITMGLTTPFCPLAGAMQMQTKQEIESIPELQDWDVEIIIDYETLWKPDMMSEELRNTFSF